MSQDNPYGTEPPEETPFNQPAPPPPPPGYGQVPPPPPAPAGAYGQPAGNPYQPAQYPQGSMSPQPAGYPTGVKPDNYLVWAILATILCCWPFGIPAIVFAAKVDGAWARGDYAGANEASRQAKKWAIISAAVAAVGIVLYIILIVVAALNGSTTTKTY